MNNQLAIELMMFMQFLGFVFIYNEKNKMLKDWKSWRIDKKIGRIFFLFMPLLTIISLAINPL